jgi:hypothetical protein
LGRGRAALFVTFRLHGTLPANRVFVPDVLASAGKAFVAMDRILDRAEVGPSYLRVPQIAELVVAALRPAKVALGGIGFIPMWSCRITYTR